jgi:hypothetical protein
MTSKPFNIFDTPVPAAKSTMLGDLELTAEEFDALKKQIAHGLGQVPPDADAPDKLANAVGEFGSATNPVGCSSVPSCIAYLKRLRTTDGRRIQFKRKGSNIDKSVSQHPIDVYALSLTDDKPLKIIYMSGYQRSDSKVAPKGFTLSKTA